MEVNTQTLGERITFLRVMGPHFVVIRFDSEQDVGSTVILTLSGDSSVGRAVDCRSIGRVFDSPSPDLLCGRNCLNKSNKQGKS